MTRRIYFEDAYPTDCYEPMRQKAPLKHPKLKYAAYFLKVEYGARLRKEATHDGRYFIEFENDEDAVAFKLKHGF